MITKPSWPHWRAKRRQRARTSIEDKAGVSSINNCAFCIFSTAYVSRGQSSSVNRPVLRRCWSKRPTEPSKRIANWVAPISMENTATAWPSSTATCSPMFKLNAVLCVTTKSLVMYVRVGWLTEIHCACAMRTGSMLWKVIRRVRCQSVRSRAFFSSSVNTCCPSAKLMFNT